MVDCILDQVWRQYEQDNRRDLSIEEVAERTGIHRDTVSNMKSGKTGRYDSRVIARLSQFFGAKEGEPVPFLIVRYDVGDAEAKKPTP